MKNLFRILTKVAYKRNIFFAFVVLNCFGYVHESNEKGMTKRRIHIQKVFKKENLKNSYPALQKTVKTNHPYWIIKALCFPNSHTLPKKFFEELNLFSKELIVKKLWNEESLYITKKTESVIPLLQKEVNTVQTFLKDFQISIQNIFVIAHDLDAYWTGYAYKEKNQGIIVLGPGNKSERTYTFRHELFHIVTPHIPIPKHIDCTPTKTMCAMGYTNKTIVWNEYVVRAFHALYESQYHKTPLDELLKEEEKIFTKIREVINFIKTKKAKSNKEVA